eukprot:TRINITY_DN7311_c0_g1_i1.p2 TRINITY_DN7311_c0_g1~~TRINITY_DN7311_c0_g1_i1.p2  ORF type:complete len:66 (+),score=4.68 TRINITY_DN7311_c0_g1_i1:185-382(+)
MITSIVGTTVIYGPYATTIPDPWPWYAYQTVFRIMECLMAAILIFLSPVVNFKNTGQCKGCYMMN